MWIAPLLLSAALVAAPGRAAPAGSETISKEQAEARLANCGSRKFEAVAEFPVDGKMKRSRLELCAADSEFSGRMDRQARESRSLDEETDRSSRSWPGSNRNHLRTRNRPPERPSELRCRIRGDTGIGAPKAKAGRESERFCH